MGRLSDDLRKMGFVTTGEESPVHEDGIVWRKGIEAVCDETGIVIDGNHYASNEKENDPHRYRNSGRVKLMGGYLGNFEWGEEDGRFRY